MRDRSQRTSVTVVLSAGDVPVFEGDVAHAGAGDSTGATAMATRVCGEVWERRYVRLFGQQGSGGVFGMYKSKEEFDAGAQPKILAKHWEVGRARGRAWGVVYVGGACCRPRNQRF